MITNMYGYDDAKPNLTYQISYKSEERLYINHYIYI